MQGKKLIDRHMDAAQKSMRDRFPHLQGLQTTLLSQKRDGIASISESGGFLAEGKNNIYVLCNHFMFKLRILLNLYDGLFSLVIDVTGSLYLFSAIGIQIMFDKERNHWIATHYQNGKVKVYHSCFSGSLSPSIREILVRLYRPAVQDNSLVVTVMPIVQQRGSADCGLFAIGTAFRAASGLSCDLSKKNLGNTSRKTLTLGY